MINWPRKEGSKWTAGFLAVLITLQSILPGILSLIFFFSLTGGLVLNNPQPADAINKVPNYTFTGPSTRSWSSNLGSVSDVSDVVVFQPTSSAGQDTPTASFFGRFTSGSNNDTWTGASITQSFTPTANVKAKLRGYYMRRHFAASNVTGRLIIGLYQGGTTVTEAVNSTWGGITTITDPSFTVPTAANSGVWTQPVLLTSGITYNIGVFFDTIGTYDPSEYWGAYVDNLQLQVSPAGLTANANTTSTTAINLTWAANTTPSGPYSNGFNLFRGTASGGPYTTVANNTTLTSTTYNYTDRTIGTSGGNVTYSYVINDIDTTGSTSPYSVEVSQLARPGPPTGVTAANRNTNKEVTVSWTEPTSGAYFYNTYYSTNATSWNFAKTVAASPTVVTVPYNKTSYYFGVNGQNASGTGAFAQTATTTQATDGILPDVILTDPSGPRTYVTTSPSKLITGTASDNDSVQAVQVRVRRDNGDYWNAASGSDGSWVGSEIWNSAVGTTSWNYSWVFNPASQDYTPSSSITVRAIDYNPNTSSYSSVFGQRIDNTPPTITSSFSINGTNQYTATTAVTLNNYVTDGSGFMSMAFANSVGELSTASFSDYLSTTSYSLSDGDGLKWVYAQYRDNPSGADPPGGYNQTTGGITDSYDSIVLDTVKPTVSSYAPTGSSELVTTNVTAAFNDTTSWMDTSSISSSTFTLATSGGSVAAGVTFSAGVATLNPTDTLAYSTTYTASLSSGVRDNAGNTLDTVAWSFTTEGGAGDSTPPDATMSNPSSNNQILTNKSGNYTISGTSTDNVSVSTVAVNIQRGSDSYYWNGTASAWTSAANTWNTATGTTSWNYTWNFNPASQNSTPSYTVKAKAIDTSNNETPGGSQPTVSGVKIDNEDPAVTYFRIGGVGNPTYTNNTTPDLFQSVTDATAMAFSNFSNYASATTTAYTTSYSGWGLASPGTDELKTVYSRFADSAGNMTTASDTITLDTTSPTESSKFPASGATGVAVGANATFTFTETNEIDDATIVNDGTEGGSSFYIKQGGSWVNATVSYDPGSKTATLNPTSSLSNSTTYTVYMSSSVEDKANNPFGGTNWNFTTESGSGNLNIENDPKGGGGAQANKGDSKKVTQRLIMTASGGPVTLESITVSFSATSGVSDIPTVYMFRDYNPENSSYDAGESSTLVSASYSNSVNFDLPSPDSISSGGTRKYAIAVDVASGAPTTDGFSSNIASTTSIGVSVGIVSPGFSNYDSGQFTIVDGTPQVTGLNIIARAWPTMSLNWNEISGATYEVARGQSSGGTFSEVTSGISTYTFNDTTIPTASIYYYKVRAYKNSQWGAYSDVKSSLSGNSNISISYSVSGTTSIQSADGQLRLNVPNDPVNNDGQWTIEERDPDDYGFNTNLTPQSPYIWFTTPGTPTGIFGLKLRTNSGPSGNTKVLWRRSNAGVWSKNVGSNISWNDYYFFNADINGFSGYLVAGGVGNTQGYGPHGGYSTASNKCKDCHAVHNAGEAGFKDGATYKLLRASTQEDVCEFCHGSQGVASKWNIVLMSSGHGDPLTSGSQTAPDDITPAYSLSTSTDNAWSCAKCHNPHAANVVTLAGFTSTKLLKANPDDNNSDGSISSGDSLTQWCAQCHGANIGTYGQSKQVPEGSGTTLAYGHSTSTGGIQTITYGTDDYANFSAGKAPTCRQCHASGAGTGYVTGQNNRVPTGPNAYGEGSFPHSGYSNSYSLLKSGMGTVQSATLDDVCNDCHYTPSLP